jgi:hypothetical protein
MLPKAIQELFTLDYGRMNATLGVELPFTNFMTQTTIPYGYIDPPTELIKDGETQLWKITHNGVDTHSVHFHLFTVQVLNRVGWDGAIRPPDPNELSWKDTVRMNPLEDVVVAAKAMKQNLPWALPDSIRPLDVTQAIGTTGQFTNIDPNNNPVTVYNNLTNFGWEYVWHCHLLGHEENDMMRPIVFRVPPPAPSGLAAVWTALTPLSVRLSWTDNSLTEDGFTIQRATDGAFTQGVTQLSAPLSSGAGRGITLSDTGVGATVKTFYYRVRAYGVNGTSAWSNSAQTTTGAVAGVSPSALAFGTVAVNSTSAAQTLTLTNQGIGVLTISSITLTGANAADFSKTTTCGASLASGSRCTVSVTFRPAAAGARSAGLAIATNDSASPTIAVTLTGTGTIPVAGISPASLTFANQAVSTTSSGQTITLSNTGLASLTITSVSSAGTNAGDFLKTNACGATLVPGAKCAISVSFRPTDIGTRTAALSIASNDPVNPTLSVALSGTGIAPSTPPSAPSSLTTTLSGVNAFVLRWTDNSNNETGFYVERSTNNSTWTRIATLAANSTTYTDSGLARRTTYWYRVQACDASGVSAYTNTASNTTR